MELTKRIGARLRSVRRSQGLTLGELSDRTRVLSKSRISNYEQGLRRMGLEEAELLAAALGTVSATYLLCLDDRDPLSGPERALVDLFRRTDERGRETILRLAQSQVAYPDPNPAPLLEPPGPPRSHRPRGRPRRSP